MNQQTYQQEARRRRLINRSAAQHRQIFFEAIHGNTLRQSAGQVRRAGRQPQRLAEIESAGMTMAVQASIVLGMFGTVVMFRASLMAALQSLLS